jgi:NTP pyrophosphatase (non-canonical NTP hydrolase)
MLTLVEFQERAMISAMYGEGNQVGYPILGLAGEAGEIANKYKKVLRDDEGKLTDEKREALIDELGDVLWYCAALARDLGTDLEQVARKNLSKLGERLAKGTIKGSGDKR